MLALPHGGAADGLHRQGLFRAALALEGQCGGAWLIRHHVHGLVHVAVGVTGHGDGLFPVLYHRVDKGHHDGSAEGCAVQIGADGTVGALPHLRQLGILFHPLLVGGDGGAFHRYAQTLRGLGGLNSHLILRLIAVQQPQIIVLGL